MIRNTVPKTELATIMVPRGSRAAALRGSADDDEEKEKEKRGAMATDADDVADVDVTADVVVVD